MHQALKTFDILDTIFSYLRDYPPESCYDHHFPWNYNIPRKYNLESRQNVESTVERRQALFRSALCCKHFSSLALKHLWWNQTTLKNILKLLPGYTFVRSENIIEIDGFLDDEDWERADMYGKLVRNFVIYAASPAGPAIEKSTYHQIQASRKFRALFPNLREIYCRGRWEEVCLLLSPSLRRVVILEAQYIPSYIPAMFTFINALPKYCPDLESLEAYFDLPCSTLSSIAKLQKLQHLGLEIVRPQESNIKKLSSISLLPNLRSLQSSKAKWSSPDVQEFLPLFHSPEAFCALQQLNFYAPLESITNWLPSFISPNLTTFTAEIDATWTDDFGDIEIPARELCYQLCNTFANHARSPLSTLRTLSFIDRSPDPLFTEVEAFQPLLALCGLETLVFDIPLNGLDDQTLIKWARAWPNLKTFRVQASIGDYGMITLFGLRELFQLCPDLKSLTLAFDATELDSVPEVPTMPSLCHGLKDWDIVNSRVNPAALSPVLAILNWVFLDIWDAKSRRFETADNAVEFLPHSLSQSDCASMCASQNEKKL